MSFTPEEEPIINQVADQTSGFIRRQGSGVVFSLTMPAYPQDLGVPPIPTNPASGSGTGTTEEAIEAARMQVSQAIDQAEHLIDTWLAQYRHRLDLYREA